MTQIRPVSRQRHADKSWTRFSSYGFAAKHSIAPLVGAELSKAMLHLPVAFARDQDRYIPVAVLSYFSDSNLFVTPDGLWRGGYVPAVFRGYPFCMGKGKKKNEIVFCVDEDSGLVHEDISAGEPFFDGTGELSESVKNTMDFLTRVEQNRAATLNATAALADAGLLIPWSLTVPDKYSGDLQKSVTGLYRINEPKLTALDDQKFLTLRHAGSLPLAYAQLLSMGNLTRLEQLAKTSETPQSADLEDLFKDDGTVIG